MSSIQNGTSKMLDDDRGFGWQLTVGRWPMAVVGLRQLP
jgi:hypothetical protein